jgi:hypothetical protein
MNFERCNLTFTRVPTTFTRVPRMALNIPFSILSLKNDPSRIKFEEGPILKNLYVLHGTLGNPLRAT